MLAMSECSWLKRESSGTYEALDEVRVANVGQQEEGNVRDRFIGSIVVVAGPAGSQLSQQQIISEGRGGVLAASTSLPPFLHCNSPPTTGGGSSAHKQETARHSEKS